MICVYVIKQITRIYVVVIVLCRFRVDLSEGSKCKVEQCDIIRTMLTFHLFYRSYWRKSEKGRSLKRYTNIHILHPRITFIHIYIGIYNASIPYSYHHRNQLPRYICRSLNAKRHTNWAKREQIERTSIIISIENPNRITYKWCVVGGYVVGCIQKVPPVLLVVFPVTGS